MILAIFLFFLNIFINELTKISSKFISIKKFDELMKHFIAI